MRTFPDNERLMAIFAVVILLNVAITFIFCRRTQNTLDQGGASFHLLGMIPNEVNDPKTGEKEVVFIPAYLPEKIKVEEGTK